MEVLVALPPSMDFNFESSCSTPYISAPSSPKLVGEIYFSAPTSPKHAAAFYHNISFIQRRSTSFDGSPLVWEENTEQTANSDLIDDYDQQDFAFDFSGQLDTASLTADELFDGGKIKPLKPQQFRISVSGSKSPKWSNKKKNSENEEDRGREKVSSSSSNPKHRATRSLSPLKLSEFISKDQEEEQQSNSNTTITKSSSFSFFTKWKLKDLLLFRSASEGRALDNDPLKKYTSIGQKQEDLDSRNSSFRSTGGSSHGGSSHGGSSHGGSTIRRGSVSAHELHYKSNRAVHDQMKRKTFLPYRKGLLGCIGFNPTEWISKRS